MTLRSIFNAVKGYNNRQLEEWQRARVVSFFAAPPEVIKKARTPAGLFPLDGDKDGKRKPNLEEIKKQFEAIDAAVAAKEHKNNG